ncbi:MAG: LptF/LptG family permease [Nitrospira sp.]|nr:LptF/LptG family permease [Nitrospira sp.]
MKIVNRYITVEFIKLLVLISIGLTMTYMVVDVFENLGDFTRTHTDILTTAEFFLLRFPQAIYYIAPITLLFASFINLGLFTKYNELKAMSSGGINIISIASPMLIITFLTSIGIFFLNDTVIPFSNRFSEELKRQVEHKPREMFFKEDSLWFKSGNYTLYNVRFIDPEKNILYRVNVYYLNHEYQFIESIAAEKAISQNGQWFLESGVRRIFNSSNVPVNVYTFDKLPVAIPFDLKDVKHAVVRASETRFGTLRNYIERIERDGYDVKRLNVELYEKTSFPFSGFVLTVIGISIAFYIKEVGSIASGIGICIVMSILYWVFYSLSIHLGYAGYLPAVLSAWMANMAFLVIGGVVFLKATKL